MQMSTAGKEAGTDVAHERLFSPTINVTEPGYVYIYLSNEEATPVEVYFDDLKVTQVKTPVVQNEDYYPFGLTFKSYQRDSSMPDQYLYNGKELQDELSLGWLDYGARMYMPELGRWGVVDPLAEKYMPTSVYVYVMNNPICLIDPDGRRVSTNDDKSRKILLNALDEVLGPGHGFSFNKKSGDLQYNKKDDKNLAKGGKGYSDDQKALLMGLQEISSNKNFTLDFNAKNETDEKYEVEFRETAPELDSEGRPVPGKLKETGRKEEREILGDLGWTGGGTMVILPGYQNANVLVFPSIAQKRQFMGANGQLTNGSTSATVIHELLDHGLFL